MPTITTDLTDAAYAGLQRVVTRWNADNGGSLTVDEWLHLHLRELAVQDEIVRAVEDLQKQAQETAAAAIRAERQRLIDSVS
jgi:hypothetical protein